MRPAPGCADQGKRDAIGQRSPGQSASPRGLKGRGARTGTDTFLAAIAAERNQALYLVAIGMGLRQGEILGLRWSDIDLEAGTLRVHAALQRVNGDFVFVEPKSATSRRTVSLPAIVATALVAHRARQAAEPGRARPSGVFADLLFTTTLGQPLDGINVTRRFSAVASTPSITPITSGKSGSTTRLARSTLVSAARSSLRDPIASSALV